MARIQISMDDDVLKRVDEFAKRAALSRSAFLSMAAVDYINAKEKAPLITSAFSSMAALLDARVKMSFSFGLMDWISLSRNLGNEKRAPLQRCSPKL